MFGDLSGMMDKLEEAQANPEASGEETKARLNTVLVDGESGNGKVKVTALPPIEKYVVLILLMIYLMKKMQLKII